jgi:hypothetical protein
MSNSGCFVDGHHRPPFETSEDNISDSLAGYLWTTPCSQFVSGTLDKRETPPEFLSLGFHPTGSSIAGL